jgi:peptidyl-tRNA hydrolase
LITVVRRDLSHGYQTAQTGHAIAEWIYQNPELFKEWRQKSGYLICLSVRNWKELCEFEGKLLEEGLNYTMFYEPDIGEFTSITIAPSTRADELTKGLQLANVKAGTKNKSK